MDLKAYFSSLCRQLGVQLKAPSPAIKTLVSGKNGKNKNGTAARYDFNDFYMDIYYMESVKGNVAQQVIWLSFFFDREPALTFSVYDILSVTQPKNFNCYTYSYVDSQELMKACFNEISELLEGLIPDFKALTQNGIEKNKLIAAQKQKINEFFGDNIIEASSMLKESGEKILQMMFFNFFQYQIGAFIVGAPAVFFNGKEEKALKLLKKAKYRSLYEDRLLKYLEDGNKAPALSDTAKQASSEKGIGRHNYGIKGSLKILGLGLAVAIPFTLALAIIFLVGVHLLFADSVHITGIKENLITLPIIALVPSVLLASRLVLSKSRKKGKKRGIVNPTPTQAQNKLIKYATILTESLVLVLLFTCINSTTVFYENGFSYSVEDFPFSQEYCDYSSVDFAAKIEGYNYNGKFQKDEHIIFYSKSGTVIDLYNSSFICAKDFEEELAPLLKEKGIDFKEFKAIEDIK